MLIFTEYFVCILKTKLTSTTNLHSLNFAWKMMFVFLENYIVIKAILELISVFLTLLSESAEESSNQCLISLLS